MAKLISIIVPVYNTEMYINECVFSVLRQTYPHFELLLVDDGSKDRSAEICRETCKSDQRVHFLSRPHRGVSATRNAGLDAAKGEYVFFLDSDDTIHPRLLEVLLELCETTGAVMGTELYRNVDRSELHSYMDNFSGEIKSSWEFIYADNRESLRKFATGGYGPNFYGIGGKLIRREAVGELRFDEGLNNGEDTAFIYQLLQKGADVLVLQKAWYEYRRHDNNSSKRLTIQACEDIYKCHCYIREQEEKRADKVGVIFWIRRLTVKLRLMYIRSREERNKEVSQYLKQLARAETRSGRVSLLSVQDRLKHNLAFGCYPIYWPIHIISTWVWNWKKRRQERSKEVRNGR